jgi:hypothetical protein
MKLCRGMRRQALALAVAAIVHTPAVAASCDDAAHRAFDFWVGEWEVRTPDGKLAGHNRIERQYGGCVLHEHYTTDRGYSGESLNIFDAARGVWHQSWVDTDGTLLLLEGGLRDGKMIMKGKTASAGAPPSEQRITWSTNPDGSVRQLWESADAQGHWTVAFDGRYTRK